ncbi:MarR family winged helix-turn-helix transcriptional regulator [Williamsia sp. Leaf354]|uniref:MarR family winged helix-turn-helix transcriptional regulator n=1 Tax=Williamsia sp. Leaf354 TaxID=1736349 RepID=UPI000B2E9190|nr:MarR family winged helix-turn-helix transcriptional regulator [Williamsia sp. Leaf354]
MFSIGQQTDEAPNGVDSDAWSGPSASSNLHSVTDDRSHDATSDSESMSPEEQRSWRAFVDGTHALLVTLDKALVCDVDLALGEFLLLTALSENDSMRMSDLSSSGLGSRSTISRQVSRLVGIGDIARLPDSTDARNRLVSITDRGLEHLRVAEVDHSRRVRKHLLAHISTEQLDELGSIFTRVRDGLESD